MLTIFDMLEKYKEETSRMLYYDSDIVHDI
jgi:hypothetical protein